MKSDTIQYHPTKSIVIAGEYEAGDSGDRDTPPLHSSVDPDSLVIQGPLSDVVDWLTDEFTSLEDTAEIMRENHESDLEFERDRCDDRDHIADLEFDARREQEMR